MYIVPVNELWAYLISVGNSTKAFLSHLRVARAFVAITLFDILYAIWYPGSGIFFNINYEMNLDF